MLFKKVIARKWGRSIEDTACTDSVEEPTQFNRLVYNCTESGDEPTQFQRVVSECEEPTQLQGVVPVSKKRGGKILVHLGSDVKHVQPVAASSRPKPRPLKWAEPPAPAPTYVKAASKAASELNVTDKLDWMQMMNHCSINTPSQNYPNQRVRWQKQRRH